MKSQNFIDRQRTAQADYFRRAIAGHVGHLGSTYRLPPSARRTNFAPSIRDDAEAYFALHGITWHTHASHGLSSQTCCLNFLMPLAKRPELLSELVGRALDMPPPQMLPVEKGPGGEDWFVGFEWLGDHDLLGEWPTRGRPTRGANATSADAVVRFRHQDRNETLLIEWKYTERYGAPIPDRRRPDGKSGGNVTRTERYGDKVFDPEGPIRSDLGLTLTDFFFEPFYQLLRQQMLAWRTERKTGERVRVLHVSPTGNLDLHKITSSAFAKLGQTDAFEAFKAALVEPADKAPRFVSTHTEDLFCPLLTRLSADPWASYLLDRYDFLALDRASGGTP
jgi:hypothetical protein